MISHIFVHVFHVRVRCTLKFPKRALATSIGDHIHCALSRPTRPNIKDEVYATVTHDATNYPSIHELRNTLSEWTVADRKNVHWDGKRVQLRRTVEANFDGHLYEHITFFLNLVM